MGVRFRPGSCSLCNAGAAAYVAGPIPDPMSTRFLSRRCWLLLVLSLVLAGPLRAGETRFPADGTGVSFTLPDGWTTSENRDGSLKCTSGDGELSFDLLPGKIITDPQTNLADAATGLADAAGLKQVTTEDGGEKANPNGVKITGIIVHGMKDDVEYVGVVSILTPPTGERCAFQCFGTKTGILVHSKDMSHITLSFKAAK
ncbi:MAG: hypothetical protein INR65_08525 [Gluconacetobacter diazotrophicus]|nr:hypothetical protein [Gluconacetobacter diazotrophicus]